MSGQEKGSCFRFRRVPTYSALQREKYDSAKTVSALNFGNNLLQVKKKKERKKRESGNNL